LKFSKFTKEIDMSTLIGCEDSKKRAGLIAKFGELAEIIGQQNLLGGDLQQVALSRVGDFFTLTATRVGGKTGTFTYDRSGLHAAGGLLADKDSTNALTTAVAEIATSIPQRGRALFFFPDAAPAQS
jgi:hypothetical protein